MNQLAEKHIAKAQGFLVKGDENYRKAAVELRAAKDAGATWIEIGDALGRSGEWCSKIVRWAESPANGTSSTPWEGEAKVATRRLRHELRTAPMEQIEQVIAELPDKRKRQIGAVAGNTYLQKVDRIADGTRRNVTEGIKGMFGPPSLWDEERALIKKLAEVKDYLDKHGDEMIPDPDGGPTESIRDLSMDSYRASKAKIDNAFAALGIGGTAIEEGFNSLLSEQ